MSTSRRKVGEDAYPDVRTSRTTGIGSAETTVETALHQRGWETTTRMKRRRRNQRSVERKMACTDCSEPVQRAGDASLTSV